MDDTMNNKLASTLRLLGIWVMCLSLLTAATAGRSVTLPAKAATKASPMPKAAKPAAFTLGHIPASHPDAIVVVHSKLTLANGKVMDYTVHTGYLPVTNVQGKLQAKIFFIAYTKDMPADQRAMRPLTFCFNGGPGAGSLWLNLGCAGPMRLVLTPRGNIGPPPFKLKSNPQTWLRDTDLVFVDPVGTGFSRPAPGVPGGKFYGVSQDVQSVAKFIRLYVTMYKRWGSPTFLAGESYGTTRACGLADYLSAHTGLALNGVILISCALNFQILEPSLGNDTPYPLFLPSYTAAAWYHHKLAPDLEKHFHKTLAAAEHFALHTYISALAKGSSLPHAEKLKVAATLAKLTGLSKKFILLANLRVGPGTFEQALLRDQRRVIGRMDTRLTGYNAHPTGGSASWDPAMSEFIAPFTSAFNQYVRQDLHYSNDLPYKALAGIPWNFGPGGAGFLFVTDNLRNALIRDPYMHVLVCSGYFDLATPFFGTVYSMDHLNLSRRLQSHIKEVFFRGGHMLYHPADMRKKLAREIHQFILSAAHQKAKHQHAGSL